MHIAILTFDGFNELDSLMAVGILGPVRKPGGRVSIASSSKRVTSMKRPVVVAEPRHTEVGLAMGRAKRTAGLRGGAMTYRNRESVSCFITFPSQ